jgi:ribosome maturation factor RimP
MRGETRTPNTMNKPPMSKQQRPFNKFDWYSLVGRRITVVLANAPQGQPQVITGVLEQVESYWLVLRTTDKTYIVNKPYVLFAYWP